MGSQIAGYAAIGATTIAHSMDGHANRKRDQQSAFRDEKREAPAAKQWLSQRLFSFL